MLKANQNKLLAKEYCQSIISEWHIGVDEAGRGAFAGPVCAAAFLAPPNFDFNKHFKGLDDSKKIKSRERFRLAEEIKNSPLLWGIGLASASEIDEVNILNATFRAMSRALYGLFVVLEKSALPCSKALKNSSLDLINSSTDQPTFTSYIDGPYTIPLALWQTTSNKKQAFALPKMRAMVKGDALLPSISAASILAKTQRDKIMFSLGKFFPEYNFAKNKGYGTKEHLKALEQYGYSLQHRASFKLRKKSNMQFSLPLI